MSELFLILLFAGYSALLLVTARKITRARESMRRMLAAVREHAGDAKRAAVSAANSAGFSQHGAEVTRQSATVVQAEVRELKNLYDAPPDVIPFPTVPRLADLHDDGRAGAD